MKFLVVLRRYNPNRPHAIGGVVVSSENLYQFLKDNNIDFQVVDTNKSVYKNKLLAFFKINYLVIKRMRGVDHVALNLNEKELYCLAPIALIFASLCRKTVSLRIFGGDFDRLYEQANNVVKKLLDYVLKKSDLVFFQSKQLTNRFSSWACCAYLPTCRKRPESRKSWSPKPYKGRFIFIGQVKKTKGVEVILQAFPSLKHAHIDIYGPLQDYDLSQLQKTNVTYKGVLAAEAVSETIAQYDFLVLPTYHQGEGYPGVIIESYAVGVPVITTNWRALPEIVDHQKSGFLMDPNDSDQLKHIVESVDYSTHQYMQQYAFNQFECFDRDHVYHDYLNKIKQVS